MPFTMSMVGAVPSSMDPDEMEEMEIEAEVQIRQSILAKITEGATNGLTTAPDIVDYSRTNPDL